MAEFFEPDRVDESAVAVVDEALNRLATGVVTGHEPDEAGNGELLLGRCSAVDAQHVRVEFAAPCAARAAWQRGEADELRVAPGHQVLAEAAEGHADLPTVPEQRAFVPEQHPRRRWHHLAVALEGFACQLPQERKALGSLFGVERRRPLTGGVVSLHRPCSVADEQGVGGPGKVLPAIDHQAEAALVGIGEGAGGGEKFFPRIWWIVRVQTRFGEQVASVHQGIHRYTRRHRPDVRLGVCFAESGPIHDRPGGFRHALADQLDGCVDLALRRVRQPLAVVIRLADQRVARKVPGEQDFERSQETLLDVRAALAKVDVDGVRRDPGGDGHQGPAVHAAAGNLRHDERLDRDVRVLFGKGPDDAADGKSPRVGVLRRRQVHHANARHVISRRRRTRTDKAKKN